MTENWQYFYCLSLPLSMCESDLQFLCFVFADDEAIGNHQIMEFFEMCAALITELSSD